MALGLAGALPAAAAAASCSFFFCSSFSSSCFCFCSGDDAGRAGERGRAALVRLEWDCNKKENTGDFVSFRRQPPGRGFAFFFPSR